MSQWLLSKNILMPGSLNGSAPLISLIMSPFFFPPPFCCLQNVLSPTRVNVRGHHRGQRDNLTDWCVSACACPCVCAFEASQWDRDTQRQRVGVSKKGNRNDKHSQPVTHCQNTHTHKCICCLHAPNSKLVLFKTFAYIAITKFMQRWNLS